MGFYSLWFALALVLTSPWWLWRMITTGRYREGLAGRLGAVPAGLREAVAGKDVIWVHAVSVGEVLSTEKLIADLREALPGYVVVLSTTTSTGQKMAREKLAGTPSFYFPLDFAWTIRRYLRALRPKLLLLTENEMWPRLLYECSRSGVPVILANARVSDRTHSRSGWRQRLFRSVPLRVSLFLAQGPETQERLLKRGIPAERIRVTGNLKYDTPEPVETPMVREVRENLAAGTKLIVCGSVLEGEEAAVLDAWDEIKGAWPHAVLLIAPRQPPRFEGVARLLRERCGDRWVRGSEWVKIPSAIAPGSVFLLDTLGSLAATYRLASVAFVGGGLVQMGGHNPLEAARFGVPVVMGPSYENFREIVKGMRAADGIRIATAAELGTTLADLLLDDHGMGERGRRFFEEQAGATRRTVDAAIEMIRSRT
jgi:3-deoxy-D-manno-octulosonic-acid transferase